MTYSSDNANDCLLTVVRTKFSSSLLGDLITCGRHRLPHPSSGAGKSSRRLLEILRSPLQISLWTRSEVLMGGTVVKTEYAACQWWDPDMEDNQLSPNKSWQVLRPEGLQYNQWQPEPQ